MSGRAGAVGEGAGQGAPRVVVVGGGLAGIAAALRCADGGARVTLLEVRPRLGGAAYSFERDGLVLDNGQHVFLRCCTAYRALLARLGSEHATVLQPRLAIPVLAPGGRRAWLRRASLPAPVQLAPSLLRYSHLPVRDRLAAARAALALRAVDPDDPRADEHTFGAWLAGHGQSPTAVAALWDLIARPTLNVAAAEASLAQAAFVFRQGLLERAEAGDLGWARGPLGAVHDAPARRALAAAGVEVVLRARVQRVLAPAGAPFAVEAGDRRLSADAVVVAVPHDRAARLLPAEARVDGTRLAALGRSPIVNLHVHYDRRVTALPVLAAVGSPVQYAFDRTEASRAGAGQLLAVSLSAADREMAMGTGDLQAAFLPALADLLPAARAARVLRFGVTREHAATFRAEPGTRALRPGPETAVPGLVLAGAWTATGWPATMEGAVRSGDAAAAAALQAARTAPPRTAEVAA
jgi:squalene-associated FAD-dependent desaturase